MSATLITGYQGFFNPSRPVTIAQSAQISSAIGCGGFVVTGIIFPQLFTGTALTFLVGDSSDGYQAEGEIVFSGLPTAAETLNINGTTLTFVAATPGLNEVLIGATATDTAANLYAVLIASVDSNLILCSYALNGTVVTVKSIVHGTAGNAYVLTESATNVAVSGSGALAGGGFRPLYNSSNSLVSMTVAAGRAYAVDPANFQGVGFLQIKSGSAETAPRTVILTLKGF